MWPPSTAQSATEDAPNPGIQNRTAGEKYSMASAIAHSTSRDCPAARPPAIQNTADIDSQAVMRTAFMRAGGRDARRRDPQEERLADLHRRIGDREPQAAPFERRRDRGRQHQPAEHQQKEQDADRRLFGIEPVGDPGGVDPHPPHREKQQRDLQHAERREMASSVCEICVTAKTKTRSKNSSA